CGCVFLLEGYAFLYDRRHSISTTSDISSGSSLRQSLTVNMEEGSRAIILDSFSVGRIARGEKWLFKELATDLKVIRSGNLICGDRIRIQPEDWIPSGLGGLEGGNYAATMLLCAHDSIDWPETANTFTAWFSKVESPVGAASALAAGGCLIRYYADSAPCLNESTDALWAMARCAILGQPPLDLRKK
ncbi:MAG: urease accessory protein UreD, partial [Chloroflexi bacterium]|nr:urease accessory protein UreD [Chloroflexota bacterium]